MQPTVPQKLLLFAGSSFGALLNPLRGDLVAVLGEVTGERACRRMRDRMLLSHDGRRILHERPRLSNSPLLDFSRLSALPKNSLGYEVYKFFSHHKISFDTRSEVHYMEDEEVAYVMQRYRECHDFLHVICALPISVVAELALKIVEFKQTGLPMNLFSFTIGRLALPRVELRDFYRIYLPWAMNTAKQSKFFMDFYFEHHLESDIEIVRQTLNITPFPNIASTMQ